MTKPTKCAVGFFIVVFLIGCSSDRKATADGVAALQRKFSVLQDMEIVVSGGATLVEYSQRVTDARLKFGGPDSIQEAIARFPKPDQQALAAQACQQMSLAMDAYTDAKQFFGDRHQEDVDPFKVEYQVGEDRFLPLKEKYHLDFPPVAIDYSSSQDSTVARYGKFYWKGDVLQELWKSADRASLAAKGIIARLAQMGQ